MMVAFLAIKNPKLLRFSLRDWPLFFGTGVVSLLFFNWCSIGAMKAAGVSVSVVLLYTSPVFVVVLSALLFHEPFTRRKLLALLLTIAGCVLVAGILSSGERISGKALLLGLGSGLGYALYSIFGRIALQKYDSMTITVWTFAFAAAGAAVCCLIDPPEVPLTAALCPTGIAATLGIAFFCCVLPYLLYTKGLTGVETGRAAILATIEPAVGALIGIIVFSEPLTASKAAGMALIFLSVLTLSKSDS
jgi:drug/metabolite transporter (DMT)-like permease